jgi:hypothetical protein
MYRVCAENWSKEEAIFEMTRGGFKFNSAFGGIIEFIERADVADLKRRAGLEPVPPLNSPVAEH